MSIGDFSWGWAGLFNLFAVFELVGEPAPTGLFKILPDDNFNRLSIGDFSWGWAGLFNLFAVFELVGEPAPTG
ncbi:hypothetical protein, partial [Microcoleus sp. Aus8_D3]|uniref:hypothetical protein n=1 Tax=Microcoleus sp. Aus8_D3 TaxID=2818633 RepID=UPI002FCF3E55